MLQPIHSNQKQPVPAQDGNTLLFAITAMALAAKIKNTDKAVMLTGYCVLKQVKPDYQQIILNIINSPSPLKHMNEFVKGIPAKILQPQRVKPA